MTQVIKKWLRRTKLAYLWITRILLAPSHFSQNPFRRLSLAVFGGYTMDQYAIYDFAHHRKQDYLSEFDWYRSRNINDPFSQMLNNKIVCTEVLRQYSYVPKLFAMKHRGHMVSLERDKSDGYLSKEEIRALVREQKTLFMKPLDSGKGKGVRRLDFSKNNYLIDGGIASVEDFDLFLDREDGWFLSEGVRQHPFLDAIYDKTTNTIRLITFRDPESGKYKVFFAVQRIGTSATIPVDNGSRGGLVSQINLETGELSEARSIQSLEVHERHPDSGALIKGAVIPNWDDIKEEMLELSRSIPFVNFVAWDILLTDRGVCVIEANASSGVNIIQLWGPQKNGELGDFYRFHKAIK